MKNFSIHRTFAALALPLVLAICLTARPALAQEGQAEEKVDNTRALLEKWVETRRLISKEKQDWVLGEEILKDRIELIQQEIQSFKKKITDAKKSLSEIEGQKVGLAQDLAKLETAGRALSESVSPLEARVNALLKQVPEPLREKVEPLSRRFPKPDDREIKLSLSARYQNVIGVLNSVNKFNSEISVASEVRNLGNGTTSEVTALYLGISYGYYVNGAGTAGGLGFADKGEWAWQARNDSAPSIRKTIKVLKNEEVAGYVQLPIEIK